MHSLAEANERVEKRIVKMTDSLSTNGCRINYYDSEGARPILLLVHGSGANRFWWFRMVPLLESTFRVVAIDLSGHGDSEWRSQYRPTIYAGDIEGIAVTLGDAPKHLVAHSMGGRAAVVAAARRPDLYASLTLLDTRFVSSNERSERPDAVRTPRCYDDAAAVRARFRLTPPQPVPTVEELSPLVDYSIRKTEQGWTWKFDPQVLWRYEDAHVNASLKDVSCPTSYVYGSRSALTGPAMAETMQLLKPDLRVIAVPRGYHHLPLDSPNACVELVKHAGLS